MIIDVHIQLSTVQRVQRREYRFCVPSSQVWYFTITNCRQLKHATLAYCLMLEF